MSYHREIQNNFWCHHYLHNHQVFSFCFARVKNYPRLSSHLFCLFIQIFLLVLHCIQIFLTLPIKMSCATVAFKCRAGRRIHHLNIVSRKSKRYYVGIFPGNISPHLFHSLSTKAAKFSLQMLKAFSSYLEQSLNVLNDK